MTKTKEKPLVCRTFKRDFPQFYDRAVTLGVRIQANGGKHVNGLPVYWLDGYRQLTGYTTNKDGSAFTGEDTERHIDNVLTGIEEDRIKIESMSEDDRFYRVLNDLRELTPRYRMIGEVRHPCGDGAGVFFMSKYDGTVRLAGIGDVAKAERRGRGNETPKDALLALCDMLDADYRERKASREVAA